MKYIGAHFSISEGFDGLVDSAIAINANAAALFTKPAMQWKGKVISESVADSFKEKQKLLPENSLLAHASYLINMGNPDEYKREHAKNAFIEEMKRCKSLGVKLLNFHPGSYLEGDINTAIKQIGYCILEAVTTIPEVMPVFETMAGQGTNIGWKLEHIRDLIAASGCEGKVGVCIDTCHSFAAGYDIRMREDYEDFMNQFDKIIGLKNLKGMHLNDSKGELGSKKDRHEELGKGYIGMDAFKFIVEDPRTDNIPLILETPNVRKWKDEIGILRSYEK